METKQQQCKTNNMKAIIFILIFLITGCVATPKVSAQALVPENNKDVFILSTLIRDYLRNTNGQDLNINDVVQIDTLKRISKNFETIELNNRGGFISVFYKFSNSRDIKDIELNETEKKEIDKLKWNIKELKEPYDGEIQFDYGERYYRIRKIITK